MTGFPGPRNALWCPACREAYKEEYKAWKLAGIRKSQKMHARRTREAKKWEGRFK
jgi:hypothetical protein